MKKIFQVIGLISLTCFSFFVTEKTALVASDMDEIMISIKENYINYNKEYVDAKIEGNTIISGVNGREVNINKSYKNMKTSGYYSDTLYKYDYTKPKISLSDNKDKYIIKGNPEKRMVSLIFKVDSNDDITNILNTVNNYKINVSFFLENSMIENNTLIDKMISDNHNVGVFTSDYNDVDFELLNAILNKQENKFCYFEEENNSNLEICNLKEYYLIKPTLISSTQPLVDIKNKLESGSILSIEVNSELKKELTNIILYIKSKGFTITNLEDNVLE